MFLFVDGEATERLVGMQDEGTLRDLIEQHVLARTTGGFRFGTHLG